MGFIFFLKQRELIKTISNKNMKIKYVILVVGNACNHYTHDNLNQYFRNKVTDKNALSGKAQKETPLREKRGLTLFFYIDDV